MSSDAPEEVPAPATSGLGRLERGPDGVRLVFERTLAAPVPRVWSALTDNTDLARWIGRWSGDPSTGAVDLLMDAEEGAPGERVTIDACEPPHLLALTVPGPEGPWPLRLSLAGSADGTTLLRFEHALAEPVDATSIGPGWQYYLDRLDAVVAGAEVPRSWEPYAALGDRYR